MIFNIDHIGLSSTNFKQHDALLTSLGYEKVFEEHDLENMPIKKPYLQEFTPTHNLALYRKEGTYGIELLQHGTLKGEQGFIFPYNKNEEKELSEASVLDTFVVQTNDITASAKFWSAFGFKQNGKENEMLRMTFNTMMSGETYHLILRHQPGDYQYYLDTPSFNSIAFVSSSADKEKRKLEKKNYPTSSIGQITVNDRPLDVFFVTGPAGELVEIISYA